MKMGKPIENKDKIENKDSFFGNIKDKLDKLKLCISTLDDKEVDVGIAPQIPLERRMGRLFPYGVPKTEKEMNKYIVNMDVPIYIGNNKRSRINIRIHRKLKNEVFYAFKELADKKKLINPEWVGSTNWRKKRDKDETSIHSYGLAIDINSLVNGGIHRGNDKKSPYYITPEFAKIMKKHGFYRGGDRAEDRKDPMHFSFIDE